MIRLFDLVGSDPDLRFSPYVWRTKMALHHKGLPYETIPAGFLEKDKFAPSGSHTVPVIDDNGTWVNDSWLIAEYLDNTYPDLPKLFQSDEAKSYAKFISAWADRVLVGGIFFVIVADIPQYLKADEVDYFTTTREKHLHMPLEETRVHRKENLHKLQSGMKVLQAVLSDQDFLAGDAPSYADYAVFGPLQWARLVSDVPIITPDSALDEWMDEMLDLYDGLGRSMKPGWA